MADKKIQIISPGGDKLLPETSGSQVIMANGKLLENELKVEWANGTSNAITLTGATLVDLKVVNFVCTANNNGTATTINTKPLYKQGTTTPPILISMKAYTVWYFAPNNCFFVKASAEGTSVASDVLAGKTFSNDSDTGLVGTMPNIGVDTVGGSVNGTLTAGRVYIRPTRGYWNDNVFTYWDEPNHLASNYLAGKTYFGLAGGIADYSGVVPLNTYTGYSSLKTDGGGNLVIAPVKGFYTDALNVAGYGSILLSDANYISSNILSGKSIFGLAGTAPNVTNNAGTPSGGYDGDYWIQP